MIAVLHDALLALWVRPVRTLSQGIGVALGAAVFVIAIGLGQTVSAQVDDRFDLLQATTVAVTPASSASGRSHTLEEFIPGERLGAARQMPDAVGRPAALITTTPGAAQVVATHLALMLRPDAPGVLEVDAPLSPQSLRMSVSRDVQWLGAGAGAVVLVVGVFAIGNLMLLSITQRVREIGMRRALGARSRQIVGMVLAEALLVGFIAGLLGAVLGLWILLGVAIAQQWSPVIDLGTVWLGVLAGCAGGVLGGIAPALVAARVAPAEALRS